MTQREWKYLAPNPKSNALLNETERATPPPGARRNADGAGTGKR